jgi:hypothetical protein
MTTLFVFKEHDELLTLWRSRALSGLRIVHVDFHDDLRGFVIDRKREKAFRAGVFRRDRKPPDEGNFLMHAVMEGIVRKIRWVRGRVGGRAYETGIVKYREDLASIPHRVAHSLRRDAEYPLQFAEIVDEEWKGPEEGEHLDIDWDYFASFHFDPWEISERIGAFLRKLRGPAPPAVYLAYSPGHVSPSREQFGLLVDTLAARYGCRPLWPGPSFVSGLPGESPARKPPSIVKRAILSLRKRGVY